MSNTVAVGEIPYIDAFIEHYFKIGIAKLYLVITNLADESCIKEYLKDTKYDIEFINSKLDETESITMDSMNYTLEYIKEKYLLHIDIDEFLDIYPYNSINNLIEDINHDKIHFNWAITVLDGHCDTNLACRGMTHRNKPFKTLCKTAIIKNFTSNGHDFETLISIAGIKSTNYLIHYWGRTFNDILIKIIYGDRFKNIKSGKLQELIDMIEYNSSTFIPVRLKMMAMLSRLDKTIPLTRNYISGKINKDKETELIVSKLTGEQCAQIYKRYTKFREDFDINKYEANYYKVGLQGGIDWKNI
jgi:DNA-dependent RNA polymerase auxiliary subunit epsilon